MSIKTEQQTVQQMIQLFCNAKHGTSTALCENCSDLLQYARNRLTHCPFGNEKPPCNTCTVHCYTPELRKKITEIMSFSGPRMLRKHPLSAIRHLWHSLRTKTD